MASKVKGLTVIINGDATRLTKAIRDTKAEASVLRSHLSSLGKLIEFNPASTELLTRKQALLGEAIAQNKRQAELYGQTYERYANRIGPMTEREAVEFRNLQRQMTNNRLEYERLKQQAIQFGSAASSGVLTARGKFESLNNTLRQVSNQALAVGAAATFVGYKALEAAAKFESSFAGVRKTIVATEQEYNGLAEAARQMALVKPVDVNDINYIMELGGQLNIAKEHLSEFAAVIADLDVSTDLDLEDASLKLAQFANIANMSQGDFDRLGATIADLGNNSATTESSIVNMAMRIVGAGSNIGMSVPQVLALATSLSSVGIQAEMGGNAISTIMNRIDKDVALSSDTLAVWAQTAGMSSAEFADKWRTNVMGALLDVIKGMGTYRDEGNNLNTLLKDMDISYMRQVDTMQRLSRTGELVSSTVAIASNAWDENIALTREASQRYDTAESKMQLMKNAINETGIAIGEKILPSFKDLVLGVTGAVQAFANMDDGEKSVIVGLTAMAAAGGLGVKALELVTGAAKGALGAYASLVTKLAFYVAEKTAETGATAAQIEANAAEIASTGLVAVAKQAATVATANLTTEVIAQKAAMALGAAAAVAAVAGLVMLVKASADAAAEADSYTEKTKQQQQAVAAAEEAYRTAAAANGETSDEAVKAKAALDQEREALDGCKETLGEFIDRLGATHDAHESLVTSMQDTTDKASSSAGAMLNLAEQITNAYNTMPAGSEKTSRLAALTSSLNKEVEGLNLSYDGTTDKLNMTTDAMNGLVKAEADRLRADAAMENYNSTLKEQSQIEADLAEIQAEVSARMAEYNDVVAHGGTLSIQQTNNMSALQGKQKELNADLDESKSKSQAYLDQMQKLQSKTLALSYASKALAGATGEAADSQDLYNQIAAKYSEMFGVTITGEEVKAQRERDVAEAAAAAAAATEEYKNKVEEFVAKNGDLSAALADSGMSIDELAGKLSDAGIKEEDFEKGMENMASTVQNAFDKIEQKSDISLDQMISNLKNNIEVTRNWKDNLATLYDSAGSQIETEFIRYIANMGVEYAPIVQALVNDSSGKLSQLAQLYADSGSEAATAYLVSIGVLSQEAADKINCTNAEVEGKAREGAENANEAVDEELANATTEEAESAGYRKGEAYGNKIVEGLNAQSDAVAGAADNLSKLAADHLSSAGDDAWWAGCNMAAEHMAPGISSGRDAAVSEADTASKHVADHFSSSSGDAWWSGYNMSAGFANGISSGKYLATAAAGAVARAALDRVRAVGEEGSPWKTTIRSGRFAAQGLAIGMEQMRGRVADSFGGVAQGALDAMNVKASALSYEAALSGVGGRASVPRLAIDLASGAQGGTVVNNYELKGINVDTAISSERFTEELVSLLWRWGVLSKT